MCGIAGYIGKKNINNNVIDKTLALMSNRGPDAQGFKVFDKNFKITLLHSRLSIIDLDDKSNQPYTKGNSTIIFNGEIYNYIELKNKLELKGWTFETKSDTEVLLTSYLEYGDACVDYLEGMWSFVIYDSSKERIFISRDRFAEKPFYYVEDKTGFYFGSEVKFIQSLYPHKLTVNENQIFRHMVNGHKALYKNNETYFNEVKELPFAHNLIINNEMDTKFVNYWKPRYNPNYNLKYDDIIDGIKERLLNSVRIRLRSDVPLAFCLSGGVDSSTLVSVAKKIFDYDVHSFSIIDSDERYNEWDNIESTISDVKCKNTKIKLSKNINNVNRLENIIKYHDAPLATPSYFVHNFLSEEISKNGYKISVSGTAADEIFTGYYDHFNLHLYEMRNHKSFNKLLEDWKKYPKKYVRHPYFKNPHLYFNEPDKRDHIYLNNDKFSDFLNIDFKENFIEETYSSSLLRNRMMNELFHEVVRPILHEDDLNSMMYSVENRSPFLDKELFEFIYSVPNKFMIQNGYAKFLLRESMNGILNDKVRYSREKKGFNASIFSIFDFKDKKTKEYFLDDSKIYNYVDKNKISNLFDNDTLPNSYNKFLFNFINCKIFLDNIGD